MVFPFIVKEKKSHVSSLFILYCVELEFDDLDSPTYRRPTKSLDHLVAITHFSRLEIKRLYRAFKAECPTGLIREDTFRAMYSQFFPKGGLQLFFVKYISYKKMSF